MNCIMPSRISILRSKKEKWKFNTDVVLIDQIHERTPIYLMLFAQYDSTDNKLTCLVWHTRQSMGSRNRLKKKVIVSP